MNKTSSGRARLKKVARFNFWLLVANGSLAWVADGLTRADTILTVLIDRFTGSHFWVGLPPMLGTLGWFLPQGYAAYRTRNLHRKKGQYFIPSLVRVLAWVVAGTFLVLGAGFSYSTLCVIVFSMFALQATASGLLGPTFMEVITKAVTPQKRGFLFGLRQTLGCVGATAVSFLIVVPLLREPGRMKFPVNYGWLLLINAVVMALVAVAFLAIKESRQVPRPGAESHLAYLKEGFGLLREDRTFRNFILYRIALFFAITSLGRFTVYARNVLELPDQYVGIFSGIATATLALASLLWGRIADRLGSKPLLAATAAAAMAAPAIALVSAWGSQSVIFSVAGIPFSGQAAIFCLVFVAAGSLSASLEIAALTFMMNLAPVHRRPIYFGFINSFLAPFSLVYLLAGWIIQWAGYGPYMILCVFMALIAFLISLGLDEKRKIT